MSANTYADQDTWAGCGGRCCKRHAGALSPSDIKRPMYRGLVDLLSTEMYQIDWHDKNPMMSFEELRGYTMTLQTGELKRIENRARMAKAYYIRPAHVETRGTLFWRNAILLPHQVSRHRKFRLRSQGDLNCTIGRPNPCYFPSKRTSQLFIWRQRISAVVPPKDF